MKVMIGIALVCATLAVNAQDTLQQPDGWTLKRCIDYAIEHNINVRQRVLDRQTGELNVSTVQYSRLPDLSADLGQNFYFGRGPGRDGTYQDQTQASSLFGVSTGIPLFSGLRVHHEVKAKKLDLQVAIEELNRAREDLSLNITSYFLQVLLNEEMCLIAAEQVRLNAEQVQQTEILVNSGKNPESELYDARAALAQEELNLTEARNTLQLSLLDLSQLLNLESVEGFRVALPDFSGWLIRETAGLLMPDTVFALTAGLRPSLKAAQLRLQSSERNLKIMKAAFYPSLSLGASYGNSFYHTYHMEAGESNPAFGKQLERNGSESLGLSLSIPIFNRLATRNQVRAARIAISSQQLELENMRQEVYKEIQQAYYNAVAAHGKYLSSAKSVEASQLAFKYEEQKYKSGKSTSYQFNDARTRLAKSLSEVARAKYEFIFRTKILDFYQGKPLDE